MLIDSHTHSRYSMDSKTPCEDNVRAAIDRGLYALGFSDHVDRVANELDYYFDFDRYIEEISRLRERYKGEIDILIACEMGLNLSLNETIESMMEDGRFDYFIGSLHTLHDRDIASTMRNIEGPLEDYYRDYYETMLETVESTAGFHILGHMDYLDRYLADKRRIPDFSAYRDIVAAILEAVIKKDLVVEYNTGGLYRGLDYANPKDDILALYRDLGGSRICLSSDGHLKDHIGRGFDAAREHLKALGFREQTYFKAQTPYVKPL